MLSLFHPVSYLRAQSVASPVKISRPWERAGIIYSRLSLTALGLPGRLIISVDLRIPAEARLNMALGVIVILYARIASGIPGTHRSVISCVASGIQSLGEKPVPPVVSKSSAICSSAIRAISSANIFLSSGSKMVCTTS